MTKNILPIILFSIVLLQSAEPSEHLIPAQAPIIQQESVPPNIYMILDNSGSMHYMMEADATPEEVARNDTFKDARKYLSGEWIPYRPSDPNFDYEKYFSVLKTPTRVDALQKVVLDLVDRYAGQAHLGFSLLGAEQSNGRLDDKNSVNGNIIYHHKNIDKITKIDFIREDISNLKRYSEPGSAWSNLSYSLISPIIDSSNIKDKEDLKKLLTKYTDGYAPSYYINPNDPKKDQRSWSISDNHLFTNGGTPLGPPLYDATKYFRNEPIWFGPGRNDHYTKPFNLEYRCQQNHIILMTDGIQNDYDILGGNHAIINNEINIGENSSDLISMARFMRSIDLKKHPIYRFDDNGNRIRTDVDQANIPWSDHKDPINLTLHTIGFALNAIGYGGNNDKTAQKTLDKAAEIGGGTANSANNQDELRRAFNNIFRDIILTHSGTGSVEDQNIRTDNSVHYATNYNPNNWEGEIIARKFNPKTGYFEEKYWSTNDKMRYDQGKYISYFNNKTILLDDLPLLEKDHIKWIKGDREWLGLENRKHEEKPARFNYRIRPLLGDIIDSHLIYSAKDHLNVNVGKMSKERKESFIDYLLIKNRDKNYFNYLIAGSNDGLLNFIYAEKSAVVPDKKGNTRKGGERHTSYFPAFFSGNDIDEITDKEYNHTYKINGITSIFDAQSSGKYHSIGITAMGAGKKGLVGYQTYDSTGNNEIKINFEIDQSMTGFKNLGYTYSDTDYFVHLDKTGSEQTVAVFGNGYTLDTHRRTSIYMIDAIDGQLIKEIILPNGVGGASSPATLIKTDRISGLHQLDRIYVGDQAGQLFKVQFHSSNLSDYTVSLMFDAGGEDYPITVRPTLTKDHQNNVWVYFGTGRAILESDAYPTKLNTRHAFYGLKDITGSTSVISLNNLDRHSVLNRQQRPNSDSQLLVTTSNQAVAKASGEYRGWYLPLTFGDRTENGQLLQSGGERVILPALTYSNRYIVFAAYGINLERITNADPCDRDHLFGELLYLDLFTGNASKIMENGGSGVALRDDAIGLPSGYGLSNGKDLSGQDLSPLDDELIGRLREENPESNHPDPKEIEGNLENDSMTGHQGMSYEKGEVIDIPPVIIPTQNSEATPRRIYIKHL